MWALQNRGHAVPGRAGPRIQGKWVNPETCGWAFACGREDPASLWHFKGCWQNSHSLCYDGNADLRRLHAPP